MISPSLLLSLLLLVNSRLGLAQYRRGNNQKSQSLERYLLDSPYNLCRQPLFARANVSATSWWHDRTPQDGWLNSGTAWSAKDSDLNQYLQFDLGRVMNITTITTKGRSHTNDYVSEFMIQYGNNGRDFSDYKEVDG